MIFVDAVIPGTMAEFLRINNNNGLAESQCSTVVRNCYKGDVASQWEIAIFGHLGL